MMHSTSQNDTTTNVDVILNDWKEDITETNLNQSEFVLTSDDLSGVICTDRLLPCYNTKEKIIFIIDRAQDEHFTMFQFKNSFFVPLVTIKQVLRNFICMKHNDIDKKHEYAVVVLNENSTTWLLDFTNNVNLLLNCMKKIQPCNPDDIFNLNTLFDTILANVQIPQSPQVMKSDGSTESPSLLVPPKFTVRAILLYGRSITIPLLNRTPEIETLLSNPYFTLDILVSHEPVDSTNNCDRILNVLKNLDKSESSYFFSVERDYNSLCNSMAKLLSHPLQRPMQKLASYSILKR